MIFMSNLNIISNNRRILILALWLTQGIICHSSNAKPLTIEPKPTTRSASFIYTPIPLPLSGEVRDILSDKDIPTGEGGFAKDYTIKLTSGEQIAIDLSSEVFDTVVILISTEGKTVSKNDDGPDGTSNSLLFTRIKNSGNYVIRIQGFGETSSGEFKLKFSKLKPQ